jgi:hypothetical protein
MGLINRIGRTKGWNKPNGGPYYARIVTERTAKKRGMMIANTKSPGKYRGMSRKEFTQATKYIDVFRSIVVKI